MKFAGEKVPLTYVLFGLRAHYLQARSYFVQVGPQGLDFVRLVLEPVCPIFYSRRI